MAHLTWGIVVVVTACLTFIFHQVNGISAESEESRRVIMNAMEILLHKQEKLNKWVDDMDLKIDYLYAQVTEIAAVVQQKYDTSLIDTLTSLTRDVATFSDNTKAVTKRIVIFKSTTMPNLQTIKKMVDKAKERKVTVAPKVSDTKKPPRPPLQRRVKTVSTNERNSAKSTSSRKANRYTERQRESEKRSQKADRTEKDEWENFVKKYKYILDDQTRQSQRQAQMRSSSSSSSSGSSYPSRSSYPSSPSRSSYPSSPSRSSYPSSPSRSSSGSRSSYPSSPSRSSSGSRSSYPSSPSRSSSGSRSSYQSSQSSPSKLPYSGSPEGRSHSRSGKHRRRG